MARDRYRKVRQTLRRRKEGYFDQVAATQFKLDTVSNAEGRRVNRIKGKILAEKALLEAKRSV